MTASPNTPSSLADNHEVMDVCRDEATGLHAIVAVHSTILGPALGGLCVSHHHSGEEALSEVFQLARAATYRSAAAGLDFGGGHALIIGESATPKNVKLWQRFGRFVNGFEGKFIAIGDTAMGPCDSEIVRMATPHVTWMGDPSSFTALGVFYSILAAVQRLTGSDDLYGRRVLVQGVGKVGLALVKHLCKAGATVYACDIRDSALRAAVVAGAQAIPLREIHAHAVDVYAPCAGGQILNPASIPQLRCSIVAGSADQQLANEERDGEALHQRGILYVPDFIANAGGMIAAAVERGGAHTHALAVQQIQSIRETVTRTFAECDAFQTHPHRAAMRGVEKRLRAAARARFAS